MDLFTWCGIFVISLYVLVRSSDYFTEAAEKLGIYFKIPSFIVGVTIIALGTSMPELASSVLAVIGGASEIVSANIVGSNIANILLILGIAAVVSKKTLSVEWELVHVDLPIFVAAAFLLTFSIMDGTFVIWEALLSLLAFGVYTFYSLSKQKEHKIMMEAMEAKKVIKRELKEEVEVKKRQLHWKTPVIFALSMVFIGLSAHFTILSLQNISDIIQVGVEIIAASILAFGTSLPEAMVTYKLARKGKGEMAVGTILGSNIFNTFAIMGVAGLIGTLIIPQSMILLGVPVMLGATILYFFAIEDKEFSKWEGWMFIILYALFIYHIISGTVWSLV